MKILLVSGLLVGLLSGCAGAPLSEPQKSMAYGDTPYELKVRSGRGSGNYGGVPRDSADYSYKWEYEGYMRRSAGGYDPYYKNPFRRGTYGATPHKSPPYGGTTILQGPEVNNCTPGTYCGYDYVPNYYRGTVPSYFR